MCTLVQVEAFNLTENSQQTHKFKRTYAYNSEDEVDADSNGEDDFEIDSTALKGILTNTGIKVVGMSHVAFLQMNLYCLFFYQ